LLEDAPRVLFQVCVSSFSVVVERRRRSNFSNEIQNKKRAPNYLFLQIRSKKKIIDVKGERENIWSAQRPNYYNLMDRGAQMFRLLLISKMWRDQEQKGYSDEIVFSSILRHGQSFLRVRPRHF
jgi:hypothetical protein